MRGNVQKCVLSRREAPCSDQFGQNLAREWFGMSTIDIERIAGRFTRGIHKGELRGWVVWLECAVGGWHYSTQSVIRPGVIYAKFVPTWDKRGEFLNGTESGFIAIAQRVDHGCNNCPMCGDGGTGGRICGDCGFADIGDHQNAVGELIAGMGIV